MRNVPVFRLLSTLGLGLCFATCLQAQKNDSAVTDMVAAWPALRAPIPVNADMERDITALLNRLSVEEKVGQLIQGDIGSITPAQMRQYRLGSILAGGNSDPGGKYDAPAADWLQLADDFYAASMDTSGGGVAVPALFGIDAVHGQSNIKGATLFPHNIGLGATRNVELMRKIGEITAIETRVTGMEWAFAPTVAVPQDDRWGRTYEGYAESPELVARFASAVVEGLQGKIGAEDFLGPKRVMVSVKHFVGDGGTLAGKDQGDTPVDAKTLAELHGAGYPPALRAGAQSVMASFNSVNGTKMHGHSVLLSDVLKQRMGFDGFVVGDWNGHGQVQGCSNDACPASTNAGVDMLMAPDTWLGNYNATLAAVRSGKISPERLNDAVRRILRVKFRLGLFSAGKPSTRALGGKFALLGAPEHRAVARQAVRESLVLLKNEAGVLPLHPKQRVLITGRSANNMSMQAGGWTLNWQGTGTKREDFPNASTIFEGFKAQVERAGGSVELSSDGSYERKPSTAIVVFGEDPYAEFQGDLPNLLYRQGSTEELALIKKLRANDIPVVAVFLSGRPLWLNREINAANAFVAAWLPGSEGEGIADVLLRTQDGAIQHDFVGKLSFSWPRTAAQFQNNVGQSAYAPQFAYGFGLNYASGGDLAALPEESGLQGLQEVAGKYFVRALATPGFKAQIESAGLPPIVLGEKNSETQNKSLRWRLLNDQAQQDSGSLQFAPHALARFAIRANSPLDLQRESNGDVLLSLRLRVLRKDERNALTVAGGCQNACKPIDIAPTLRKWPMQRWQRLAIPLKCLAKAGGNLAAITELLALESKSSWEVALSHVELAALNEEGVQLLSPCP